MPLQHFLFPAAAEGLYLVVDEKGKFREDNFQKAMSHLQPPEATGGILNSFNFLCVDSLDSRYFGTGSKQRKEGSKAYKAAEYRPLSSGEAGDGPRTRSLHRFQLFQERLRDLRPPNGENGFQQPG